MHHAFCKTGFNWSRTTKCLLLQTAAQAFVAALLFEAICPHIFIEKSCLFLLAGAVLP